METLQKVGVNGYSKIIGSIKNINSMTLPEIATRLNLFGVNPRGSALHCLAQSGLYSEWRRVKHMRKRRERIEKERRALRNSKSLEVQLSKVHNVLVGVVYDIAKSDWKIERAVKHYYFKSVNQGHSFGLRKLIELSCLVPYKSNGKKNHPYPLKFLSRKTAIPQPDVSRILKHWGLQPSKRKVRKPLDPSQVKSINFGYELDIPPVELADFLGVNKSTVVNRYSRLRSSEAVYL